LNSNHSDLNFATTSTFSGSMLKGCGLLHPKEHDELCPALQYRVDTANIRCPGITRPKPRPPFAIEMAEPPLDGFEMDNGSTGRDLAVVPLHGSGLLVRSTASGVSVEPWLVSCHSPPVHLDPCDERGAVAQRRTRRQGSEMPVLVSGSGMRATHVRDPDSRQGSACRCHRSAPA
jgi:hypothetical protein